MQNSKEKTLSQRIAERIIKYILEENLSRVTSFRTKP